jgi:hypothetical protein
MTENALEKAQLRLEAARLAYQLAQGVTASLQARLTQQGPHPRYGADLESKLRRAEAEEDAAYSELQDAEFVVFTLTQPAGTASTSSI